MNTSYGYTNSFNKQKKFKIYIDVGKFNNISTLTTFQDYGSGLDRTTLIVGEEDEDERIDILI